jgi:glycosyltransferase involved in cell wall biosynthesis
MRDKSNHTFMILAYKESPYLEQCIVSLLKQTVKNEILLSTSTPSAFLDKISEKYHIPLIVNGSSEGIASDWSFALNNSQTKYVTLAHQDDIYLPQYTEQCLSAAEKIKTNLITFTNYYELFDGKLRKYNFLLLIKRMMLFPFYILTENIALPLLKKWMLSLGNPICCPAIMYNKENIGQFEFDAAFSIDLDWEASLRLAKMTGDFIYIKKKLFIRRIHKDSETFVSLSNKKRQSEDRLIFDKLWPRLAAVILSKAYSIAYKSNEVDK